MTHPEKILGWVWIHYTYPNLFGLKIVQTRSDLKYKNSDSGLFFFSIRVSVRFWVLWNFAMLIEVMNIVYCCVILCQGGAFLFILGVLIEFLNLSHYNVYWLLHIHESLKWIRQHRLDVDNLLSCSGTHIQLHLWRNWWTFLFSFTTWNRRIF